METSTMFILLGAVALGGGAYYLYKSGKLVGAPTTAASAPMLQVRRVATPVNLNIPQSAMSGYGYGYGY